MRGEPPHEEPCADGSGYKHRTQPFTNAESRNDERHRQNTSDAQPANRQMTEIR